MKQNFFSLLLFTITLMVGGGLFAQTPCDPDGDGNPETEESGEGEGTDNVAGDLAWDLLLNSECPDQGQGHRLKDYDPTDQCNNSSNLIPESGLKSLKIAIIDSGVRPTEPGFFNGYPLYSFRVSPSGTVASGAAFPHPHGTYSAGVISGMLSRHGITAFDFTEYEFYDYQVLNGELRTSLAAVAAAISDAADKKVNIIALSIGFVPRECDNIDWDSPGSPLSLAIKEAREAGTIIITSAGNDGNDLAISPQYPAATTDLHNIITVGALSCEGNVPAEYSNFGDEIVDVFTTGSFVQVYYNGCFHGIHGTSFATSIVAGKAALHLTKDQDMDRTLCLLRSQTKPFKDVQYALYGIVDVPDISEDGICANGEIYDPNGGSEVDEETEGGVRPGIFNPGEKSGLATDSPGPITGYSQNTMVKTSPNPFSDQLRVDFGTMEGPTTVSLLDGHGRRVFNRQLKQPSVEFDLGHLPAGVYWLNVRNAESNQTRKVIKK